MININGEDFEQAFDPSRATVGVIGRGYVGTAVEEFFGKVIRVLAHDPAKAKDSLEMVVNQSEVIFVCVPTPMRQNGECYTGIVESVLADIVSLSEQSGRNKDEFIVVVKSTLAPGFTEQMREKYGLRLVFSPEFLTEANSVADFENTNRVVFGGSLEDARVLFKYFEARLADKISQGSCTIVQCEPTVAEMAKLFTNAILMTKVIFGNEMYKICEKLGADYEAVWNIACLDRRIGASHFKVPGPDGDFGAGGHCFPKDIQNLRFVANQLGTGEKLFSTVIERNNELRTKKDWEDMKDRAVTDK